MSTIPARPDLSALVGVLGGAQTTRLVGGAVRDALLGHTASDVDLATRLDPDDVLARLAGASIKALPTGKAHGTITAVLEWGPVEVTTLRRDVATDGRHATVAFTADWREDAARRDFTINALYADPDTGEVFDYFGGLDDLPAGHVRFIGDPLQRIAEDHLRILRYFRFFARFGKGEPDADAVSACTARANDIMALSRERIAAELLKLLALPDPRAAITLMLRGGIFAAFMPEVSETIRFDALVVREQDYAMPPGPIRRLAALIGPYPQLGSVIARRLRFSNAMTRSLVDACRWTERDASVEATAYRFGKDATIDRLLLAGEAREEIAALDTWTRPLFPLSGADLLARGFVPGPRISATLGLIESQWIEAGFPSSDDVTFTEIVERVLAEPE